jgi:aminoglycoside phosphotransferase (APT) family kinase protein
MTSTSSDITSPRPEHQLNSTNLLHYLQSNNLIPFPSSSSSSPPNLSIQAFSHGQSNPTYLITLSSTTTTTTTTIKYVLRKAPPGKIISQTAHRMDREYLMLKSLSDYNNNNISTNKIPIPQPLSLCLNPEILGSSFYIMEFKQGLIFKDVKMPELSTPQLRKQAWFSIMDALSSLHDVNIQEIGLQSFGPLTSDYFQRQIRSLSKVSQAQREIDLQRVPEIPFFQQTGELIAKSIITSIDEPIVCIVHGDYKVDNVIMSPDSISTNPKVIAVLDWEMSTLGTFGADLANLLAPFYIPQDNILFMALNGIQDVSIIGLQHRDELIKRYCLNRKRPQLDYNVVIKRMKLYVAFYMFKTAVILQGVAARSLKGQASSAKAEMVGQLAPHAGIVASQLMEEFLRENNGTTTSKM